jgi:hypothetical protein
MKYFGLLTWLNLLFAIAQFALAFFSGHHFLVIIGFINIWAFITSANRDIEDNRLYKDTSNMELHRCRKCKSTWAAFPGTPREFMCYDCGYSPREQEPV